MGQAKNRGTFEQRKKLAEERNKKIAFEYYEKHKNDPKPKFPSFMLPYIAIAIAHDELKKSIIK